MLIFYLGLTSSLESSRGSPHKAANPDTVDELQRVAQSLTESLTDKDTALKHQRNTNRYVLSTLESQN